MKRFVRKIIRLLPVRLGHFRVSIILFSSGATIYQRPSYRKAAIIRKLNLLRKYRGSTATYKGLRLLRKRGMKSRFGTSVAIVITDGRSNDKRKTGAEAAKAKKAGYVMISVGVGNRVNKSELKAISSNPTKKHEIAVKGFQSLMKSVKIIAKAACTGKIEPSTVTTGPSPIPAVKTSSSPAPTHPSPIPAVKTSPSPAPTQPSTAAPTPSTAAPTPSTTAPTASTAAPTPSTAAPSPSTAAPIPSTAAKTLSTAAPSPSTAAPSPSTAAPSPSTAAPSPSTAAPTPSTSAPSPSTAAPTPSTAAPTPSTAAPTPSTAATTLSTSAPTPSTAAPTTASTDAPTTAASTAAVAKDCTGMMDLVFIVDESNSVKKTDFEKVKKFIIELTSKLPFAHDKTHVGLLKYSTNCAHEFWLNQGTSKERVTGMVNKMKKGSGETQTHIALEDLVAYMTKDKNRRNVAKVALLITDGKSDDPAKTADCAKAARSKGITLMAVGVGASDKKELIDIASYPKFVFQVDAYDKLTSAIMDAIVSAACAVTGAPTQATKTPPVTSAPKTYPKTCAGVPVDQRKSSKQMIDADGTGKCSPFMVTCDFTKTPPVTIIHHKQENSTLKNCKESGDGKGCKNLNVQYIGASTWQTNTLVKYAVRCEQYLEHECKSSAHHTKDAQGVHQMNTWWNDGSGNQMSYWAGGDPKLGGCECYKTKSCAGSKDNLCNCDAKDNVWRSDKGTITERNRLPIRKVAVGDISKDGEEAKLIIGPLRCW